MHEIRATIPPESVPEAVELARRAGIREATTQEVFVHGSDQKRIILSVETSTPKAREFVDALRHSSNLADTHWTITSREVRAITGGEPVESLTLPMSEPVPDLIQDLWQLSHVTWSYVGRALAGSILLATGIIEDSPISIVVAALFLPFLSQIVATSFGIWWSDRKLTLHGIRALVLSMLLALLSGALVAWLQGGPIGFHRFKSPLSSFAISVAIGVTAGLSSADDTGRRYLIGVAAAVQLAIFPVWFGAAFVLGLPSREITVQRLESFVINVLTIAATSGIAYAMLHMQERKH